MNTDFAHLRAENKSFYTDKITDIGQFFENGVVHFRLSFCIDVITAYVHLDASFAVLQFHKRGFSHDAAAHNTTCYADLAFRLFFVLKISFYIG